MSLMSDGTNDTRSPAERYAASRSRAARSRLGANTELARFRATLDFELDDFQVIGAQALEDGHGVLVAAPTGAGKTVVGEFAVHLALTTGRKAFYTTPIKALSNQKFHDLSRRHGAHNVGLLTGDTSVNSDAPVVVMTTEVLRNMLYAGSGALDGLGFVIMDEVHYLADRFRGPVWEEVIIHLPRHVQVVSLSATVSNAEEFGDWLEMVRGGTRVVVSERRPVPLWQHVAVSSREPGGHPRLLDLYSGEVDPTNPGVNPPINPELAQALQLGNRRGAGDGGGWGGRGPGDRGYRGKGGRRPGGPAGQNPAGPARSTRRTPPRFAVVNTLRESGLLPAIDFIFSRAGCEGAVAQCLTAGLRLTTPAEEHEIRQIIEERTASLPPEDLDVLGFWGWKQALEQGIAAHHAGLLPVFKETVEELFVRGLVKVVFATETLALGINMPAKSVVLEKLLKWDGTAHQPVTPGEYTQLTGRAGRRGIDIEGHAIVVDHQGLDPVALAGLASKRTYPLNSSFKPTYNMAVNLVSQVGCDRAREILELSFAQFQADRGAVDLARQVQQMQEALAGYAGAMTCDRGDFAEYADLRQRISALEKRRSRPSIERGTPVTPKGKRPATGGPARRMALEANARAEIDQEIAALRRRMREHPCHACPEREDHARWAERHAKLATDQARVISRIESRTGTVARTFDKTCSVLEHLGYLSWRLPATVDERSGVHDDAGYARPFADSGGVQEIVSKRSEEHDDGTLNATPGTLKVTSDGSWLRKVYAENDLLLAECLRRGIWNQLDPPALAAAVSAIVYSGRRDEGTEPFIPGGPNGALAVACKETTKIWGALTDLEEANGLSVTGDLDFGIVAPIQRWAAGRGLEQVLRGTELAAGDLVRWCKQVLDVLDQLTTVAPNPALRTTARRAITQILRGVVAYSSL